MTRITQRPHISHKDYSGKGRYITCQRADGGISTGTNDTAYFLTYSGSTAVRNIPLSREQKDLLGTRALDPITEAQRDRLNSNEIIEAPQFLLPKGTLQHIGAEHLALLLDRVSVSCNGSRNNLRTEHEWVATARTYSNAAADKDERGNDRLTDSQRGILSGRISRLLTDIAIEGLANRFQALSGAPDDQPQPQPMNSRTSPTLPLSFALQNVAVTNAPIDFADARVDQGDLADKLCTLADAAYADGHNPAILAASLEQHCPNMWTPLTRLNMATDMLKERRGH